MGFTPPQFKDIGKKAKDLLSKKYDFKNELKTTNKADGGITLESGSSYTKGLDTYVKATYKDKAFGECETEIHTAASAKDTKAKVTLNKFCDGSSVSVSGTSVPSLSVEATYKQDMFASLLCVNHDADALGMNLSAAFGMNGSSAGLASCMDLTGGNFALKSLDFGAETSFGKTFASLATAKNQKEVKLSLFHPICKDLQVGGALVFQPKSQAFSATLGTEYTLDKALSVKGRFSSSGVLGLAVEHKLKGPGLNICVSAELDALSLGKPADKFGMSLAFD